jgi:LCP family protein required for cell wall assembly
MGRFAARRRRVRRLRRMRQAQAHSPALSRHRADLLGRGYRDRHLDPPRVRYRRALTLCLMTVVVPGSAQLALGRRTLGWTAMGTWAASLLTVFWLLWSGLTDPRALLGVATDQRLLMFAQATVGLLAVGWVVLVVDAFRLGRPFFRLPRMRVASVLAVNSVVLMLLTGSAIFASETINAPRQLLSSLFTSTERSEPMHGRYNIALIGSDSDGGRFGMRPDSMTVASIDANTGRTVLVSLPRNLERVPFPEDSPMHDLYPYGYNCGDRCLLNAVHSAAEDRSDLYPDERDPGLAATIDAIEGATGLRINYHVVVTMDGFADLIDAVGGVKVDVPTRIARFGATDAWKANDPRYWIEPGNQVLSGKEALWYGRSRYGADDYARMGRQKCLMTYMLDQLSPRNVLLNAEEIASSSSEMMSTDIPAQDLQRFVELARKARQAKISTVSLVPPAVSVGDPDYPRIHQMIAEAIDKSEQSDAVVGPPKQTTEAVPTAANARVANQASDLTQAC